MVLKDEAVKQERPSASPLFGLRDTLFRWIFVGAIVFGLGSSIWLLNKDKPELVPQLWISLVAVVFGYLALSYSREKFRLDLLDRRFEIYMKTLEFCSIVFEEGSLNPNERNREAIDTAVQAAAESFRGIGYHKARALFGSDIYKLFQELNKSYSHVSAFGRAENRNDEEYWKHVNYITELTGKLPEHFKPYVYFGDYKMD